MVEHTNKSQHQKTEFEEIKYFYFYYFIYVKCNPFIMVICGLDIFCLFICLVCAGRLCLTRGKQHFFCTLVEHFEVTEEVTDKPSKQSVMVAKH